MNVGIEDDGTLVAAALTHPGTTPGVIDSSSHDVYFFSLEVLPAYRGKGLGSQLVRERLRIAREGGRAVELHCMHAEYPAYSAQSLAACGYRIVVDEWLPDFYKTWGLDAGARHLRLEPT
jgi:GNAT superfamily N-acetyltransferase